MSFGPDTVKDNQVTSITCWKAVKAITKIFWRRFIREHLSVLQIRKEWDKAQRDLKQNDLVLFREDNILQSSWPLARVIETYPGKDDIVCSAKIKLPNFVLTRPCNKLWIIEECN